MTVQTTYGNTLPEGYEGDYYSDRLTCKVDGQSAAAEAIPYGRAAKFDAEGKVAMLSADTDKIAGVATLEVQQWRKDGLIQYEVDEMVNLMKVGAIRMRSSDALAKGATPFVRYATASSDADKQIGMLMASAGTSEGVEWTRAEVLVGCEAGGLAAVYINTP